jgi:hypothetical protein
MTLGITALGVMTLSVMRLIATLSPTFAATWCNYFTRHYAKCVSLNGVALSAIMLCLVILSVVVPLSGIFYKTFFSVIAGTCYCKALLPPWSNVLTKAWSGA